MVAQLGVLLFMFVIGLELDLIALRKSGRAAMMISQVSIYLPMALGIGLHRAEGASGLVTFAATAVYVSWMLWFVRPRLTQFILRREQLQGTSPVMTRPLLKLRLP